MPRDRYSLMTSFWTVPLRFAISAPCSSAAAMYRASSHGAVALIVIDVFIPSSGIWSNRSRMSAEVRDRHPDLSHFALRQLVVAVIARLRRQVEGDRKAGLAPGEVFAEERVRCPGRRIARHMS